MKNRILSLAALMAVAAVAVPAQEPTGNLIGDLFVPTTETVDAALDELASEALNLVGHEETTRTCHRKWHTASGAMQADVRIIDGAETYSGVVIDGKSAVSVRDRSQPWSDGELRTIVAATRGGLGLAAEQFPVPGVCSVQWSGVKVCQYSFRSAASDGRWQLYVGKSKWNVAFLATVTVAAASGHVMAIDWMASPQDIPVAAGVKGLHWEVFFQPALVGERMVPAPHGSVFEVSYASSLQGYDRLETTFSAFHRFGAESILAFDLPETHVPANQSATASVGSGSFDAASASLWSGTAVPRQTQETPVLELDPPRPSAEPFRIFGGETSSGETSNGYMIAEPEIFPAVAAPGHD